MAEATGIVITKRFNYRGNPNEEWSNKYWLTGSPPSGDAAWNDLFFDLVALEKTMYLPTCEVVSGIGYNDNAENAHAVWTIDLVALSNTQPGTLAPTTGIELAGDQAGLIFWRTNRKSSRGKWIYLRKFMHAGVHAPTDTDLMGGEWGAAAELFKEALFTGTWAQGRVLRSQTQDEVLTSAAVSPFVTTRTLKRRGRRPLTPAARSPVSREGSGPASAASSSPTET